MSETTAIIPSPTATAEQKSSNPITLDVIIKILPLFTGLLIFIGVLGSLTFYSLFGINILQYISLSEAILFSLNSIMPFSFSAAIGLTLAAYTRYRSRHSSGTRKRKIILTASLNGLLFFCLALALVDTIWRNTIYAWLKFACLGGFVVVLIFIAELLATNFVKHVLSKRVSLIISCIFFLIAATAYFNLNTALNVKYDVLKERGMILVKDSDKTIKLSDSLIYIGRVDKFTFLYNRSEESTEVIANDQIVGFKWLKSEKATLKIK